MQRLDVWLTSDQFALQRKIKAPRAYWLHLVPAEEVSATLVLVRFGNDPREYMLTPARPLPLVGQDGISPAQDLYIRTPYGPDCPATLLFQTSDPRPATITRGGWQQKYVVADVPLAAGGAGDTNNLLTVPCRGMRTIAIAGACTDATGADHCCILSVFAGVEARMGSSADMQRRVNVAPILAFPGMDTSIHRNRAWVFPVPPDSDFIQIRGWRYAGAVTWGGTVLLSSQPPALVRTMFLDAGRFDLPTNGATFPAAFVPAADPSAQHSLCRYTLRNDAISPTNVTCYIVALSNIGKQSGLDNHAFNTAAAPVAAPAATTAGATAAGCADGYLAVPLGAAGAGQDTGSIVLNMG
jgi:hypothetical protein